MAYQNLFTNFDVHSERALPADLPYLPFHSPLLYDTNTPGSTLHHISSCYICYTYMAHVMDITHCFPQAQDPSTSAYTFSDLAVQRSGTKFLHGFREGFSAIQRTGAHVDSESFSSGSEGSNLQFEKENHTAELLEQARAEIGRLQNQLVVLEEAYNKLIQQVASRAQGDMEETILESESGAVVPDVDEKQNLSIDTTNDSDPGSDESFYYVGEDTEWGDVPEGEQKQVASFGLKLSARAAVDKASDQALSTTSGIYLRQEQERNSLVPGSECHSEDQGFTEGEGGAFQSVDFSPASSPTQSDLQFYSVNKIRELMDHAHCVGGEEARTQVKSLVSKAHATPPALRTEVHTVFLNEWRRPQVQASTPLTDVSSSVSSLENYVYVDASDVGIGFVFDNRWEAWRLRNGWRQGGWKQGKLRDIQWAETVAVELGVRVMIKAGYAGKAITLCSDNMQVVQAFSQERPIGEPLAQEVLSNTERLCRQLKIDLKVVWIPGARNSADDPSRLKVGGAKTRFPCHVEIPPYLQDVVLPFYQ